VLDVFPVETVALLIKFVQWESEKTEPTPVLSVAVTEEE
jgi:hypothetical protein